MSAAGARTTPMLRAVVSVAAEKRGGETRFEFGENWRRFARDLSPHRVRAARDSIISMLGRSSLEGVSFLDAGSGSGLFSLAATRLGASPVHSFDYDPDSVATTKALKERFAPDASWTVDEGSVLDSAQMSSLGRWDIVYSWGVLHHTGNLWLALANACELVKPGGWLFISVYNDQGWLSRLWTHIKRIYNRLPHRLRIPYVVVVTLPMELKALARQTLKLRPHEYLRSWRGDDPERGMSRWRDLVDWVGGYPFEVATPERVFDFCTERGFELRKLRTVGGSHGCNEFVFERTRRAGS
jgi:2-polyprenyl-3-methyl-5-hydroxy-6-metoxy-1,4-benzoquinol methylase